MGSTRTPGKTMKLINGKPLLEYSYSRSKKSRYVDEVIIATTTSKKDDYIAEWCSNKGINFTRGSENDVLDRYYKTALMSGSEIIIRVTSDCPFVDPEIIDLLILYLRNFNLDYVSNRINRRTWPHGLDVEVFTFQALEKARENAKTKPEREHVTPYIMNHPEFFNLYEFTLNEDLSHYRITVDYPEDVELTKTLIEKYRADKMNWREIISLLETHPELTKINSMHCLSK
jgi:spore coat polysaccharide biosynthesis protein SpsF